jgi:HD domain
MSDSFSPLQKKIIAHPYFQSTKNVIENNICHPHEAVYDHLMAAARRAEKASKGEFVTDAKAKVLFDQWMQEEQYGMTRKDIVVTVALLHDIGKILIYEEDGVQHPINETLANGMTRAKGHEYWGGSVAEQLLQDVGMSDDLTKYIANLVKIHNILMFPEFDKAISLQKHVSDMKTFGRGFEKEVLFNTYVDTMECSLFHEWIEVIKQMFNDEKLYQKRNYFVS